MAKSTIRRVIGGVLVGIATVAIPLGLELGGRLTSFQADLMVIGGIIALGVGGFLLWDSYRSKRKESTEKLQNAHVTKIITDAKLKPLLALLNALQALGELDIKLANKLGRKRIKRSKLKSIQSRLRKDWGVKSSETYNNTSEQTIRDVVNQTVKNMGISYTSVNKETMTFMLHIAGVLDDEEVGISAQREKDDRYKSVIKLQAKVATQELNNAIKVYLWYSLGINSILLFMSYFPTVAVRSMLQTLGKTSTELRAERKDTLQFLLTNVSKLVEKELYGEEQK